MTEFIKGTKKDNEEILDFGNYVFSHSGGPTDFLTLLPKFYREGNQVSENRFLAKEDGKIKAAVGALPMEYDAMGETLKVYGIGDVSVHPYARGRGYMKQLMGMAREEMLRENADLSVLSGLRQRYEYFGYEPAGISTVFAVSKTNLRHRRDLCSRDVELKLVSREDTETLDFFHELHKKQPFAVKRPREKLFDILCSWNNLVFCVYSGGERIGSLACNQSRSYISELELTDYQALPSVLNAFLKASPLDSLEVPAAAFEGEKIDALMSLCEGYSLRCDGNYAIFHFGKVVSALMKVKASCCTLADGQVTFSIENANHQTHGPEDFTVRVKNGVPEVTEAVGPADVKLDYFRAIRLLFSPASFVEGSFLPPCARNWFPLPLRIFGPDAV